jgi:hypothetical protein
MENTFMKNDEVEIVEEKIGRDKIVSFTYFEPYLNKNINEILRVVGMPGDRFKIWRGNIYINDQLHELPKTVKLGYYLKVKEGTIEGNLGTWKDGRSKGCGILYLWTLGKRTSLERTFCRYA